MNDPALTRRLPTEIEAREASRAAAGLAAALTPDGRPLLVEEDEDRTAIYLSHDLAQLLAEVLMQVGRGEMVTVATYGAELTTYEAANLLDVSHAFLIRMLDERELPAHSVGSRRRVRTSDVLAFRAQRDAERREALRELQRLGEEFDES